MNSSLRAFAEDPNAYLPPPAGAVIVDDERFFLSASANGKYAGVCRIRTDDVAAVYDEVRAAAPHARITWTSATSRWSRRCARSAAAAWTHR